MRRLLIVSVSALILMGCQTSNTHFPSQIADEVKDTSIDMQDVNIGVDSVLMPGVKLQQGQQIVRVEAVTKTVVVTPPKRRYQEYSQDGYYSSQQGTLPKPTWGERAFYKYMSQDSFSPIRLRDTIAENCERYGFERLSQSCYVYAKNRFQAGAYEGFGSGVETLGYALGWSEKKSEPFRDRFKDGFRRGQNND